MTKPPPSSYELTRQAVLDGSVRAFIAAADPSLRLPSEEEQQTAVRAMLEARPDGGGDVWLFAYGSLLWNPMIHFEERRVATLAGYHRRFCLWTRLGRGSNAAPGLTLGLEPGGSCRGLAYRIAAAKAEDELRIVWGREMITGAYQPRWCPVQSAGGSAWAIAFVINRQHAHYAGLLAEREIVAAIARAKGPLGPCAAYLFNTAGHLESLGIPDRRLFRLRDRVAQELERMKEMPD